MTWAHIHDLKAPPSPSENQNRPSNHMSYVVPENMFKIPEPTLEDYRVLANRYRMALEAIQAVGYGSLDTIHAITTQALEGDPA